MPITGSSPSTPTSSLLTSTLLQIHTPYPHPSICLHPHLPQKREGFLGTSTLHNNRTRHKLTSRLGEANQQEKRGPKRRQKSLRQPNFLCQESHQNTKLHNHDIYATGLVQTHAAPMIASSVSVSLHEPCLLDSPSHALPMSLSPLFYTVPPLPVL